ncbi:MAG: tRNA lysidine(34) synthetase TilS [Terriglobales bacterium]
MAAADPLLRRFAQRLDREGWFAPGDRVAVAVSGGSDSVALLLLLRAVAAPRGLQLSVAHFDHRWRRDSAADAEFVAALATRLELPIHSGQASSAPLRDREQQARHQRYSFFTSLIAAGEVDSIATAHTADDQAETVLLRLFRGSSPAGLAGILPRRADGIVRPLLAFRRAELRAWLASQNQGWRDDPTNADLTHPRNFLRHRFLPELAAAFNPALVDHLATFANLALAEEEFWTAYLDPLWRRLWQPAPMGGCLSRRDLLALPLAVQRRLLRHAVRALQGDLRGLDALALQEILQWAASPSRHPRRRRLARCECLISAHKLELRLADKL